MTATGTAPPEVPAAVSEAFSPYLTTEQTAAYLHTTVHALYVARARGVKPGTLAFKVGRRLFFDPADLEQYVAECRIADVRHQPRPR